MHIGNRKENKNGTKLLGNNRNYLENLDQMNKIGDKKKKLEMCGVKFSLSKRVAHIPLGMRITHKHGSEM